MTQRMPMTRDEAESLAAKREMHKSKHQTQVRWQAVHNSVKGWHVALVPIQPKRNAEGLMSLGEMILMDRVRRTLGKGQS